MLNNSLTILILFISISCFSQNRTNGDRKSFNDGWKFAKGVQNEAEMPEFDDSEWKDINLPHDWAIEGPFNSKYNARTGGLPVYGLGWYRKSFKMPEMVEGKVISIIFDGAMDGSEVWINGNFLGNRPYGYIGFQYEISNYLYYGEKDNVISVKLSPENFSSRWYPGAGIYRNTWIEINNSIHVAEWGTFISTPHISKSNATILIKTNVENSSYAPEECFVISTVFDSNNNQLGTKKIRLTAEAKNETEVSQEIKISKPHLWDLEDPYMYKVSTKIELAGKVVDTYETPFGIRKIKYSPDKGFMLNGKQRKIKGVCLHHDLGPLGTAVNYRATERQLDIMKEMGVNSIRTTHNPPSPEQLELCDKMGILVQVEAFDVWEIPKVKNDYSKNFEKWHERDLKDMIRRDRNHPSVIMWSIGNEVREQIQTDGWKIAKRLNDICHEMDSTRPTTAGFNRLESAIKNGLADEVDIVGFNYKPTSYEKILKEHPDWIILGTETSSCTSSRGVYHLPIEKYETHPSHQVTSYDIISPPWAYPPDVEFEVQDKYANILGEYIWTGFDYLGEPTPYGGKDNSTNGYWNQDWPTRSSFFGAVDLAGFPKDRFYLYQSQWSKKPMVHVLPHWNWEGKEGEVIPIYSYTNAEEVELFVNGNSMGKKTKGKDKAEVIVDFERWERNKNYQSPYRLRWDVPYHPGSLKVVAYDKGKVVAEKTINTAGKPYKITLVPDRTALAADGKDLSFISVLIEDGEGNLCPWADNLVRFDVKGKGEIVAVGNGNPSTIAPFIADYRRAFYGKCLLIVKSKTEGGSINIKAISENLKTANISIEAK